MTATAPDGALNWRITMKKTYPSAHFLNRELGLLAFNRRVLAQAADETAPLLERLRFLTIVSSNLEDPAERQDQDTQDDEL